MAQHDMVLDNSPGATIRSDINAAILALVTNSSGATEPTSTYPFMWWPDTTADILKQRNAANTAWIDILTLSTGKPIGLALGANVQAYIAPGTPGNVLTSTGSAWVSSPVTSKIQSVSATVASNALTVGLGPTNLDFRSPTLTSGVPNTRSVASALSIVVPSGATLGTVSATPAQLALLAIDNAGTVELAVVNLAGGNNLDETTLISTTAISAAATAANVCYSTTARTGVPFRVVGSVDVTEATAGIWATSPSKIQGCGGQALAAMSSLGHGQTWQDITASRVLGTTYYNTTGKPIFISVYLSVSNTTSTLTINGAARAAMSFSISTGVTLCGIVPQGGSYSISGGAIVTWNELR